MGSLQVKWLERGRAINLDPLSDAPVDLESEI
jgi:hypothetical protein